MTRHGMAKTSAAGITPPATDPNAPVEIPAVDRLPTSWAPGCKNRADAQRRDLSVAIDPLPGCSLTTAHISRRSKTP